MSQERKSIRKIREESRMFYKKIGEVYCPYFKDTVIFNSRGFNHLRYRKERNQRHLKEEEMRYKLLHFAPELIKDSNTLQEYEKQQMFFNTKRNECNKKVQFFGFIAIIRERKIKVIIRQIGDGNKHFWSIIPNWKTRKSKEGKNFINHTGHLDQD